jgi:hypothetical protein
MCDNGMKVPLGFIGRDVPRHPEEHEGKGARSSMLENK